MSKKVLLLGSSYSAVPILDRLKKRGYHVAVCGNAKSDPCHLYADTSYFENYADIASVQKIFDNANFDYLVPSCNDTAYMTATRLASEYGFCGYDTTETAEILHQKNAFRAYAASIGLSVPAHQQITSDEPLDRISIDYPLLVKPVDSFSGRGVTKVEHPDDLSSALQTALASSKSNIAVAEAFIEGTLHSYSVFIEDQKICFDTFVDEFCTVYPYQVNCSNHPSALSNDIKSTAKNEILSLINQLRLSDGLLHTQFMVKDEKVWIIECMRRCPGDLFGHLVYLSNGVDYIDYYLRPFINESIEHALSTQQANKWVSRHTISVARPLAYFGFSHQIPAKNTHFIALKDSGKQLISAPYDKLGILFAEHDDHDAMIDLTPKLHEMVNIHEHGHMMV